MKSCNYFHRCQVSDYKVGYYKLPPIKILKLLIKSFFQSSRSFQAGRNRYFPEAKYVLTPFSNVMNAKYETLRERENNVFLCEPETFWLIQLRDHDRVFWMRARDVQIQRCSDVNFKKANKLLLRDFFNLSIYRDYETHITVRKRPTALVTIVKEDSEYRMS